MDPILHLSLPVSDLAAARAFYVDVLGCPPGRASATAADVWFLGMQLTLQERPEPKAYLADPAGNIIELKAYADHGATLRATAVSYA